MSGREAGLVKEFNVRGGDCSKAEPEFICWLSSMNKVVDICSDLCLDYLQEFVYSYPKCCTKVLSPKELRFRNGSISMNHF